MGRQQISYSLTINQKYHVLYTIMYNVVISDNLNSSSFIKPGQPFISGAQNKQFLPEQYKPQSQQNGIKMINDLKSLQLKLQQNNNLTIYFDVHQVYKKQVSQSVNYLKNHSHNFNLNLYMKIYLGRSIGQPTYSIYIGKKLIANLNMTRQYKQNIQMAIDRYSKLLKSEKGKRKISEVKIFDKNDKFEKGEERDQVFKGSYEQDNEAPSFTTYQLQQRLNQDTCQDYLLRMYQERILKKYQYLKLSEKCEQNFVEFYRIFCEGAIDNDYENFRNQILLKVENNLEILLSNVDEMDLSRPISREEQRRQNLKKSVSDIQIVKVQNYFEILDQIKHLLTHKANNEIISELLDENPIIFELFSDYLSRKISKQQLATSLQNTVEVKSAKRPLSRCFPRSANNNKTPLNQSDDLIGNFQAQQQPAKPINFMNLGQPKKNRDEKVVDKKQQKNEPNPPMFGSSKNQGNFSPIKYMSDIDSNYKQAWSRLESKAHLFRPQQYGLLYHYLHARDDSISNIIQQLEWDQQASLQKLKDHLAVRITQIMRQNFNNYEISVIQSNKSNPEFDCIFQNFKYESDLNNFLISLKSQLTHIESSPTDRVLTKKKSDGQLLGTKQKKKGQRRYSDEQQLSSPKSSFSHPKTVEPTLAHLEIMNSFWVSEFEQMTKYCKFAEKHKQQYIRDAFKQGNPAVYGWLYRFIRNKKQYVDSSQIKKDIRISEQEHKILSRMVPIFNQFLTILSQQGHISDKIRQWHISEIVNYNIYVISIIQCFIQTGNEEQFIENLTISYEYSNKDMQYYRLYLKRIQSILEEMSAHDQIGIDIFKLYPQQIKAFCQLYHITGNTQDLLDNLHLLHTIEANRRKLKVATLNFSGINMNPFEYHDGTEEIKAINQNMKQILDNPEVKQAFKNAKFSNIDKKLNNNTVSVRFGKNCLNQNQQLLNKQAYLLKWREQFEKVAISQLKKQSQENKGFLAIFDYYCYISVISYLYEVKIDKNYQIDGIQQLDSEKLRSFLERVHNRPSSQAQTKQQLVLEYLLKNDIDVFFLQEAGSSNWGEGLIHNYHWIKNGDSVIIFKQDKIGKIKNSHDLAKFSQKLNFNNDTAFLFSDRGYLLVSSHLTSKDHKTQQILQAFDVLSDIKKQHPLIKIIVGIDANHYLGVYEEDKNFLDTVPKSEQQTTSTKQRTYMQVQLKKADVYTSAVKDQILSTLPIKDYQICVIDGKVAEQKQLLPNWRHPYDHFIVCANI